MTQPLVAPPNTKTEQAIVTRLVIGGPARCGKTTLARSIGATNEECFVLGVDALFRAILRKGIINRLRPATQTVRRFLSRPRYQDAARKTTETALKYSPVGLEKLLDTPSTTSGEHPVSLYGRSLDKMALLAGKTGWVAFDLHTEFAYPHLRRLIPNLDLTVILREPREAIAAVLYWRRPVGKPIHTRREFRRAVLLWYMSAVAALAARRRWPADVTILQFSDLFATAQSRIALGQALHVHGGLHAEDVHFRYEAGAFIMPDGRSTALLAQRELAMIVALLNPLAHKCGLSLQRDGIKPRADIGTRLLCAMLGRITAISPETGTLLLDMVHSPLHLLRRRTQLLWEAKSLLASRFFGVS